ncbi:MAG: DUF4199 domain-containing protein [Cytophagales bacterium]|nr:DUF4199 domain-containing protein [Cytophaga sp.]
MLIKNELIAGVCIALGTFIWICLEFATGLHSEWIDYHSYITNLAYVIPVIGIHWAVKKRYYTFAPGTFQIKDGLISGVIASVVSAALTIPLLWMFFTYINPAFFASMIGVSVKHAMQKGENAIQAVHDAQEYYNLSSYLIQAFTAALMLGLLISLMVSFRLMKKEQSFVKKKQSV